MLKEILHHLTGNVQYFIPQHRANRWENLNFWVAGKLTLIRAKVKTFPTQRHTSVLSYGKYLSWMKYNRIYTTYVSNMLCCIIKLLVCTCVINIRKRHGTDQKWGVLISRSFPLKDYSETSNLHSQILCWGDSSMVYGCTHIHTNTDTHYYHWCCSYATNIILLTAYCNVWICTKAPQHCHFQVHFYNIHN